MKEYFRKYLICLAILCEHHWISGKNLQNELEIIFSSILHLFAWYFDIFLSKRTPNWGAESDRKDTLFVATWDPVADKS